MPMTPSTPSKAPVEFARWSGRRHRFVGLANTGILEPFVCASGVPPYGVHIGNSSGTEILSCTL